MVAAVSLSELDDGETVLASGVNASNQHLLKIARRLGIRGRSSMSKKELAQAIQEANDQQTARARRRSPEPDAGTRRRSQDDRG